MGRPASGAARAGPRPGDSAGAAEQRQTRGRPRTHAGGDGKAGRRRRLRRGARGVPRRRRGRSAAGGAAPRPGEPGGLGVRGSALRPHAGRLRSGAHDGAERPRRRGGEPATVAAISAGKRSVRRRSSRGFSPRARFELRRAGRGSSTGGAKLRRRQWRPTVAQALIRPRVGSNEL